MAPLNPYSVMNSFDGTMYGGGIGAKRPMRQFPTLPNKNPQTNPYSFTGQDQYGTLQGGGMSGIAPNANQMAIRSANNVGVQNPTQNVANNPYASMFPSFNASDLSFADNYMTVGEGGNERTDRLPGLGTLSNVRNYYPEFDSLRNDTHMFMQQNRQGGYDPNAMELLIKTAGKEGTRVPYTLQNGQWVPDYSALSTQNWDTGNSFQNRALAMIAGGALASPYITQALGAGATGAAGAAGAGGMGSAGGLSGIDALIAAGEGIAPIASSATPTALGSAGSAALGSGIGLGGAGGLSGLLSGLGNRTGNLGSAAGRLLGGGGGGQGGRGAGGGGGLAGLVAALYGSNAQENYADQLNQFISEMRANANPYMTRLQESYTNPEAYMNSPEMQARLGLEANRLTGIDASKGRLSNDIQRTKLLQDYGMAGLNDYRTGLRNTVQNLWNPNQVFQAQAMMGAMDSAKYSDLARLLGQGTQGGFNVGDTVGDIRSIIDAGGDLWDYIKGWFLRGGSNG